MIKRTITTLRTTVSYQHKPKYTYSFLSQRISYRFAIKYTKGYNPP